MAAMLWVVLVPLILFGHTVGGSIDLFDVRTLGSGCFASRIPFFVLNNTRHRFPDRFTMLAYGFWEAPNNDAILSYPEGEPIVTRWAPDIPNPYMQKYLAGPRLILEEVHILNGFSNAGFLYRASHKDWLLKIAHREKTDPIYQFLGEANFRIVQVAEERANKTSLSENLIEATRWMNDTIDELARHPPSVPFIDLPGSDCRLLDAGDDRVLLSYSDRVGRGGIRPRHADLYFWEFNGLPFLATEAVVESVLSVPGHPDEGQRDQKNWVPFAHDREVYFVSHIWPFNVVSITVTAQTATTATATASPLNGHWTERAPFPLPWEHGNPHGSTQAVRMPNGEYLAFFHSYKCLAPDNTITTYAMGAYTFAATSNTGTDAEKSGSAGNKEALEFRLTAISPVPIVTPHMYSGRWYRDKRLYGYVDYAVFPVSAQLEGASVFLMYAAQNARNYMARLDLAQLIGSLHRIDYSNSTGSGVGSGRRATSGTGTSKGLSAQQKTARRRALRHAIERL